MEVLFWNLMNFSDKRISAKVAGGSIVAAKSLNNILNAVQGNNPADIFALIELPPGPGAAQGNLVTAGSSSQGAIALMNHFNTALGKPAGTGPWKVVPPVVTGAGGKAEGLAVFYRSDNLDLTGPWVHTGAAGAATQPAGKQTNYPFPWNQAVPLTTTKVKGKWKWIQANKTGGQWGFKSAAGKIIEYPSAGERRPWFVRFTYPAGPIGTEVIEVFAFHAPFGKGVKVRRDAANQLSKTPDITRPITNTGVYKKKNCCRLLGGDFNLNANNPKDLAALNLLTIKGGPFTGQFLTPTIFKGGAVGKAKNLYCMTSLRSANEAKIAAAFYPFYKYASSAYDHIFTYIKLLTHGALAASEPMVINQVTGADIAYSGPTGTTKLKKGSYGLPAAVPAAGGTATFTYPCMMKNDIPSLLGKGWPAAKVNNTFQNLSNYGHIRTTSDHMGVVIDIS